LRSRLGYSDSVNKGLILKDTLKNSPHMTTMANIGKSHIHIEYGSPGVKNRPIWGQLVPYDQVWVTGANKETTINFSKNVHVYGRLVAAGTYSFYTIPGKDKWIAIFRNQDSPQPNSDYSDKKNEIRFALIPERTNETVQRLRYSVVRNSDSSGSIDMEWDIIKISLPISSASIKAQRDKSVLSAE
jgi:hypothetical protein